MAIPDGALTGNPSLEWLFNPASLGQNHMRQVRCKFEWAQVPIMIRAGAPIVPHGRRAMTSDTVAKSPRHIGILAGFQDRLHPHALRRAAFNAMERRGVPLHQIQHAMDHAYGSRTFEACRRSKPTAATCPA